MMPRLASILDQIDIWVVESTMVRPKKIKTERGNEHRKSGLAA
jgi:hypothetical protein